MTKNFLSSGEELEMLLSDEVWALQLPSFCAEEENCDFYQFFLSIREETKLC